MNKAIIKHIRAEYMLQQKQNHFNISESCECDDCAVFYMTSMNSRSPRARPLHIFTVSHIFYACTFHT